MKKIFLYKYYNFLLKDIYNRTLKNNGFTPRGVCWNTKRSQYIRFSVISFLLNRFPINEHLKIADVGCGYAELLNYFNQEKKLFYYEGYDINQKMIDYCKNKFHNIKFHVNSVPINNCDVSIMSGTYNYAVTDDIDLWEGYLIHNLSRCIMKSNLGVVFNLQFEKKRTIRNNIYYTNINFMFELLKQNFKKIEKFYTNNSSKDIYFIIYKN